jgi:DNA-binding transcriptional MerR regulator
MRNHTSSILPPKETFRIGEVARLAQLQPYVLRYWEREFAVLQPHKSARGQRRYRPDDVRTVLTIKHLLYDEGYTIAGARRHLHAMGNRAGLPLAATPAKVNPTSPGASRSQPTPDQLQQIRAKLVRLLTLLSRR